MNDKRTVTALKFITGFILFSILLATLALILNIIFNSFDKPEAESKYTDTFNEINGKTIIIDAGHGGEDGGAVGINNVVEKDLNLDIAFILRDILKSAGYDVIMTRTDDRLLYTENIKGTKKMQDLKNRLEVSRENPDSIFISIHMNTFVQGHYSGLQVYFSPNLNDASYYLANNIQTYTKKYLQPDNNRKVKKAASQIYLLDKITTPAVMIECGFLTNYEEAELLASSGYRHKLSAVIYSALNDYIMNYEM